MQRRNLLRLGLASAAVFSLAGWLAVSVEPGWRQGRLSDAARGAFAAFGAALLDGSLPTPAAEREQALAGLLDRLAGLIAGLPEHAQAELSQLLTLLTTSAGRIGLCGVQADWPQAGVPAVQAALQSMRVSRVSLRQQAYHALHDLVGSAYFSAASTWPQLGYPGPVKV